MHATMIGLDIAKLVFQAHGETDDGRVVLTKRLRREALLAFFRKLPPATIGIEACGSAHHWSRELGKLGHTVRLLPPPYVKPFVLRNKTDARDAEAICIAMRRPNMRFVPEKSIGQQLSRALETTREMLVKQRTQLVNMIRGLLGEFGVIAAQGVKGFCTLQDRIERGDPAIPSELRAVLTHALEAWKALGEKAAAIRTQLEARAQEHEAMRRLMTIPGVGPLCAHAIVAAIGDGRQFRAGRDFASWIGATPREHQSANKRRHVGISRQGDERVRRLLVLGASAVMRQVRVKPARGTEWMRGILGRRPIKVAVVALAAKTARIAWSMLRSGESYRCAPAA